jgi:putative intracellular protease/amidase
MTSIIPAILMILTSTAQFDSTNPTGLWFEEFAIPYEIFLSEGWEVTVVSVQGGKVPLDPRSTANLDEESKNGIAIRALDQTISLKDINPSDYNAVFFPGGHGTMFDFPENPNINAAIQAVLNKDGVVAAVCHGPAAFVGAKDSDGKSIVSGRRLTSFTNAEETAAQLDKHVPFMLETRLRELGAEFVPGENFKENVIIDKKLITGQNPASSAATAKAVVLAMKAASDGR